MNSLSRPLAHAALLVGVAGAVLAPTAAAQAIAPPNVPLAACSKLAVSFAKVTPTSFVVVFTGTVTKVGRMEFGLKNGFTTHDFFGSSGAPDNPAGTVYTVRFDATGQRPGSTSTWQASCLGGTPLHAEGTVRTPAPPVATRHHVVRPGDCLWGIARRELTRRTGSVPSAHQVLLYVRRLEAANPSALGLLHPGKVLVLP